MSPKWKHHPSLKPDENDRRRNYIYEVIFEADTPLGKLFDLFLIVCILLSVLTVVLDSVSDYNEKYSGIFYATEWLFTILFTVEYILRLYCVGSKMRYAWSFFGVVDLLSILPTYVSILLPNSRYLAVVRILRVLRVFRVLKLAKYLGEASLLSRALLASRRKILIFLFVVMTLVVILGSFMYIVEGAENGFTSIPTGIYWAIVTLTTVGYGDLIPATTLGKAIASVVMICGYGIIAVPTGIVTVELSQAVRQGERRRVCPECGAAEHDDDANFCKSCGAEL